MPFTRRRSLAVTIPLLTSWLVPAALGAISIASKLQGGKPA